MGSDFTAATRTQIENTDGVTAAWSESFAPAIAGIAQGANSKPYFYAAPNVITDGDWTNATLFVIKGTFWEDHTGAPTDFEEVYYAFQVNRIYDAQSTVTGSTGAGTGVFANMNLSLKINITRKGSDEEEPSYLTACTVTGVVQSWDNLAQNVDF